MGRFGHQSIRQSLCCLSPVSLFKTPVSRFCCSFTLCHRPMPCHVQCAHRHAHHHVLPEVLPASGCATSTIHGAHACQIQGIACETRWQSWRISGPSRGGSTQHCDLPLEGRGEPREPPAQHPALDRERPGNILADEGMDGPAWPRMSDGLRLGQRAPVPGGRLTPEKQHAHGSARRSHPCGDDGELLVGHGMALVWPMAQGL